MLGGCFPRWTSAIELAEATGNKAMSLLPAGTSAPTCAASLDADFVNGLVGKSTGNLHVPKGKSIGSSRFALEAIHFGVELFRNQSQPLNSKCLPEVFIALEPGQTTVGLANRDEKSEESSSPSGPLWLTNPRLPLHFSEM
jgi:hypothetical protein